MTSPDSRNRLAQALRARRAVIADAELRTRDPARHLEELKAASEAIEAAAHALPAPVDRELAHYLERASYDKALAYLEHR